MPADSTVKGVGAPAETFDGSDLRILIVHARWNEPVITPLVKGCIEKLRAQGVKKENIVVESVPGSYELPMTCQRMIAASQIQASSSAGDIMGTLTLLDPTIPDAPGAASTSLKGPFAAAIAIGTLIKGHTSHYEYISEAVTHGIMRVQLDSGVPVIYGVLNCLTEEQALQRAGVGKEQKGHNHGEDWGNAAVELGSKAKKWAKGII